MRYCSEIPIRLMLTRFELFRQIITRRTILMRRTLPLEKITAVCAVDESTIPATKYIRVRTGMSVAFAHSFVQFLLVVLVDH